MKHEVKRGGLGLTPMNRPNAGGLPGRCIVVTRAPHQAGEMANLLSERGANVVLYPCIEIQPPGDTSQLDAALREAAGGAFDWLVFTSANTAWIVAQRLKALNLSLDGQRVATVGPKTAEAVSKELGLAVDLVAETHIAEGLAAALQPVAGQRILLPQSAIARPVLADTLRAAGADVTAVTAYQTVMGQGGENVSRLLGERSIDAITFTSSSTVRYFLSRLEADGGDRQDLTNVCLAAIGPVTARTIKEQGLEVSVQPAIYTLPELITALESYFMERSDE